MNVRNHPFTVFHTLLQCSTIRPLKTTTTYKSVPKSYVHTTSTVVRLSKHTIVAPKALEQTFYPTGKG